MNNIVSILPRKEIAFIGSAVAVACIVAVASGINLSHLIFGAASWS